MENNRASSSARNHHFFFKILIGDFEKRLRIPDAFTKHFSQGSHLSQPAILQGPSSNNWLVKLNRNTDGMCFEEGWETFLRDHSLHQHDFLVFRYDGNMHFNIRIFDKSACQRADAFTVNHLSSHLQQSTTRFDYDQSSSPQGESSSRHERYMANAAREAADSFTSSYHYFMAVLKRSSICKPFNFTIPVGFARAHLPGNNLDLKLRNEGKMWRVHCYVRPSQYSICGGWQTFVQDNHLKEGDFCAFELVDTDEFVMKTIPVGFARAHLPGKDLDLELRNVEGKMWRFHCFVRLTQYSLCGGWHAFVHDNHLKQGDYCVFELVDKDELVLNVHFFRC